VAFFYASYRKMIAIIYKWYFLKIWWQRTNLVGSPQGPRPLIATCLVLFVNVCIEIPLDDTNPEPPDFQLVRQMILSKVHGYLDN